jgi:hypothetical protein
VCASVLEPGQTASGRDHLGCRMSGENLTRDPIDVANQLPRPHVQNRLKQRKLVLIVAASGSRVNSVGPEGRWACQGVARLQRISPSSL